MRFNLFIPAFTLLLIVNQSAYAQTNYSKFLVAPHMKDTFSFAGKWDYSWEIFKDESTGEFSKALGDSLLPDDTTHLFYTANCFTNVQGGYSIRYCFADQNKDSITLTFSDGLPAYASEFFVYLKKDSFYFEPKTIYPSYVQGRKILYRVTSKKLILNKSNYSEGDIVMGYIDVKFAEIISVPKQTTQRKNFYLKGFIRTQIKPHEKPRE